MWAASSMAGVGYRQGSDPASHPLFNSPREWFDIEKHSPVQHPAKRYSRGFFGAWWSSPSRNNTLDHGTILWSPSSWMGCCKMGIASPGWREILLVPTEWFAPGQGYPGGSLQAACSPRRLPPICHCSSLPTLLQPVRLPLLPPSSASSPLLLGAGQHSRTQPESAAPTSCGPHDCSFALLSRSPRLPQVGRPCSRE